MGASKRVAVGLLAGALSVFGVAFAPTAGAVADVTEDRVAGTTRFGTATAACARAYPNGTAVAIIATARNYPDALAASSLAGANDACIFLTETNDVPDVTLQGLSQNKITRSIIVGGTNAVSEAAANELRAAGQTVTRVAGVDRYATAAEIARAIPTVGQIGGQDTCLVASGEEAADALAAGPVAARGDGTNPFPILLVRQNDVPAATSSALAAECDNVIIVGGTARISPAVATQIGTLTGDTTVERIAGNDRFETSALLAQRFFPDPTTVLLANGLPPTEFFSVDALVAGPLGGVLAAPVLLVQKGSLPTVVRDYLDTNSDTIATILAIGGTAVIDQAVLDAAEDAAQTVTNDQNQVTLTSTSVQQGGTVTGTITGENIQSVTVTGCGLNNQTVGGDTDNNAANGRQFSIQLPESQAPGNCTLTFTITTTDNKTVTETEQVTVTQRTAGATATARPELQSAQIVSTTAPSQATTQNPQGTVVRYVFDENVGAVALANQFFVYRFNETTNPIAADSASIDPTNPRAVLARFNNIVSTQPTQTGAATTTADLSVATVNDGAVVDAQGLQNPEGDAALATGIQSGATLTAGRTVAPDLVSVSGFRAANPLLGANRSTVDFVFDQAAFVQNPNGFALVLTDGTQVACAGPAAVTTNQTAPGGGTTAGGNGTTTITVVCEPAGGQSLATTTGQAPASVARGTVFSGTVGTTANTACPTVGGAEGSQNTAAQPGTGQQCNPLEASDQPNSGTIAPDLESVTFQLGSAAANTDDVAIFTFDQPVATAGAGNLFRVYLADATEVAGNLANCGAAGAAACPAPVIGTGTASNQVAVSFGRGTLTNAVGGNVLDNAVQGAGGQTNQQDEAAATNVTQPTQTAQPAGRTTAPDLVSVAIVPVRDQFNTITNYNATYTFDEAVTAVNQNNFYLFLADGTRLTCTAATPGTNTTANPAGANTVTCTNFGTATVAQRGAAVAGTVDRAAVTDANANQNPEGYEVTTGGTGTAQQ